jgi:hypothetical protein
MFFSQRGKTKGAEEKEGNLSATAHGKNDVMSAFTIAAF